MADPIYETSSRQMRRIAIESALVGISLTALIIVLMGPSAGAGARANAAYDTEDVYARLPRYPTPFTSAEIIDTQARLADAKAALSQAQADTDETLVRLERLARTPPPRPPSVPEPAYPVVREQAPTRASPR